MPSHDGATRTVPAQGARVSEPTPMRLRTWLLLGYGTVLAVAVFGLVLGLVFVTSLADSSRHLVDDDFEAIEAAAQVRRLGNAEQFALISHSMRDTPGSGMSVTDNADALERVPGFAERATALVQAARAQSRSASEDASLDALQASIDRLAQLRSGAPHFTTLVEAIEEVREGALVLYRLRYDRMKERGNAIHGQAVQLAYALALLALCTVAVGVWASLRIANRLSRPLEHLVHASDRVATGDFTVRTERSGLVEPDRVAQRFDEMVASLERFHAMNLDRIDAERQRLDQVVANIDDGLVIFDAAGRIERVNPVAALQLGVDADHAVGAQLRDVVDMPSLHDDVARLLAQPDAPPPAHAHAHADLSVGEDGARRTLSYSLLPFSDTARLGLILVLRDVTEQRRFERLRTDFILRASHELRTPITGMRMALGVLCDRIHFAEDSREHELLDTLQQETERLVALITELFDLSRLYASTFPHAVAPVDTHDLLLRVRERFAPRAQAAGVALELDVTDELPMLDLDLGAMDRVLDNLVANALRHTPTHGTIRIGASASATQTAIWVEDTGEGIAPADRARVFEPFMQFGGRVGGAGLGLAMCREIVQQHGGRIQLDSTVGEGSRFTLLLPR